MAISTHEWAENFGLLMKERFFLFQLTGRLSIMLVALLVHTALLVTLLTWKPQAHLSYVIYILAVIGASATRMVEVNC